MKTFFTGVVSTAGTRGALDGAAAAATFNVNYPAELLEPRFSISARSER